MQYGVNAQPRAATRAKCETHVSLRGHAPPRFRVTSVASDLAFAVALYGAIIVSLAAALHACEVVR